MGLRERNHQQTRHHLVETARQLFEEYGYDGTTIEMIADAADVSPRTFYRYFESKAGITSEPCRVVVGQVAAVAQPDWSALDLIDALGDAVEQSLADSLEWSVRLHRESPGLIMESAARRQRLADELARGLAVADNRTQTTLEDRCRAVFAVQLVGTALDEWLLRRPDEDFRAVLTAVQAAVTSPLTQA